METFIHSILRILKPGTSTSLDKNTLGTGFLVSGNLVLTCAHLLVQAGLDTNGLVTVCFSQSKTPIKAQFLDDCFSEKEDVAVLRLEFVPEGILPLRLAPAASCRAGSDFRSFGYAIAADVQGIHANGKIDGFLTQHNLLQLQAPQANHGISGAPILDEKRGVVVGMITKGHTELGRNEQTTFASSSEVIWLVCPQLKPPTPILPHRNPIVEGINLLPYDYDQRIQNFLTEYLGTDTQPVPFGGRDNALKMLDTWLPETTPYLLLAAPAGRGKSALLVRWLDRLKEREDLALAFVPVSIRFGTNMERVFYAALAARLAFLHGDDVPASPETSTAVYRGLVSDYLSKPLANGRMLLVVLDGLDEAADWQAGADFTPGELPAGVRVVVSARFLAGDADSRPWLGRLNWEHMRLASAPSLVPLDQEGVRDVLFKMGCPLDELSRQVDIVAELYRLSEGDPLLVGLYVGDLWAKGEEITRLKPEDLANIQPGYKGYFDRWWDDQKKLWGKGKPWLEQHVWNVLNLLAGTLGPLFIGDIQALAPKFTSNYIADALDVLQRFIIGDNQIQGYTFSHPKLGQYFWEALTPAEQAQVEENFLIWGEQTLQEFIDGKRNPKKKDQIPAYVVRNYGAHLARAKQPIEKWLPLIHQQQWVQAWFTVEGAYGGYLQDVQRTWDQCMLLDKDAIQTDYKALYIGQQIRCALIESSLHSLAGKIPTELIGPLVRDGLWTLPQTWVFIRQMPRSDQQSSAIISLMPHLDDKQLLEALESAQVIPDEWHRARMLSALAQLLPEGELGLVLKYALDIQDEWHCAGVLYELAQRLPENELGRVLEVVQAIENEEARAYVLGELVQRLPENILRQALEISRAIQYEVLRANVLCAFTQRLPESIGEALETAQAIQFEEDRANVLCVLAQCVPEYALISVLEAARAIKWDEHRAKALNALAQRLPESASEALEAARAIVDYKARAKILIILAENIPQAADEALTATYGIPYSFQPTRAYALLDLTRHQPKMAREALEAARDVGDEGYRARIISDLAQYLPEAVSESLEIARTIRYEPYRAHILSHMAQCLPESVLGQVLDAARAIQHEDSRSRVLCHLAQRIPDIAEEALVIKQAIKDDDECAGLLSTLAQYLPELTGEVLVVARAIQNEKERAYRLSSLAQYLPEVELGKVLSAMRSIKTESYRILVLSTLQKRIIGASYQSPKRMRERRYGGIKLFINGPVSLVQKGLKVISCTITRARVQKSARVNENSWELIEIVVASVNILPGITGWILNVATQALQDERQRANMLSIFAQRLPEEKLGHILDMALAIQKESPRARVLIALVPRIPGTELVRILESARVMQDEIDRILLLSTLVQRLPNLGEEVLKAADAIDGEKNRASVLSVLAQYVQKEKLGQVLDSAMMMQNHNDRHTHSLDFLPINDRPRIKVISALILPMLEIRSEKCYEYLEAFIKNNLSHRTRADLFSDLAAIMPVIIHLGTEDTPREIYAAVHDVTTWWP